jgi:biopolymer transport protein TolQ
MNLFSFVNQISLLAEAVLGLLLFLSSLSWGVIFYKWYILSKTARENKGFIRTFKRVDRFSKLYQDSGDFRRSTLAFMFRSAYEKIKGIEERTSASGEGLREVDLEIVHRTLLQARQEELSRLESYLQILATTANISPFIGLFGTVWGIIHAFRDISHQSSAGIAAVAPGIADALVTTAAGLFAAIPAVIGYNYFIQKIRGVESLAEAFNMELLNVMAEGRWKD